MRFLPNQKITIYPIGGIGNQLFILSAGIHLAKQIKSEVTLDFSRASFAGTQHGSELSGLLDLSGYEISQDSAFIQNCKYFFSKILRKVNLKQSWIIGLFGIYQSRVIGYDPRLEGINKPVALEGYFQSYIYAESAREEFVLNTTDGSNWLKERLRESKEQGFVSLHIRRGDYTQSAHAYGLLDSEYYERSLDRIPLKYKHLPIWVFSDEISEARKVLSKIQGKTFNFITPPKDVNPVESLILMTFAKVNIIANSTYSWWGAFLNQNSIVFAPNPWFANITQPEKLIPPEWNLVPSSWS